MDHGRHATHARTHARTHAFRLDACQVTARSSCGMVLCDEHRREPRARLGHRGGDGKQGLVQAVSSSRGKQRAIDRIGGGGPPLSFDAGGMEAVGWFLQRRGGHRRHPCGPSSGRREQPTWRARRPTIDVVALHQLLAHRRDTRKIFGVLMGPPSPPIRHHDRSLVMPSCSIGRLPGRQRGPQVGTRGGHPFGRHRPVH